MNFGHPNSYLITLINCLLMGIIRTTYEVAKPSDRSPLQSVVVICIIGLVTCVIPPGEMRPGVFRR